MYYCLLLVNCYSKTFVPAFICSEHWIMFTYCEHYCELYWIKHLLCVRNHSQFVGVQWRIRSLPPAFFLPPACLYWGLPCAWHCAGAVATVESQGRCGPCPHGTYRLVRKAKFTTWFSICVKWSSDLLDWKKLGFHIEMILVLCFLPKWQLF